MLDPELIQNYNEVEIFAADPSWVIPCQHFESTFHQLSPYIGKLKSNIAKDLIEQYSKEKDIIFDPFSGSGTIPLEAAINGRDVIASDASIYAKVLTLGKLNAPTDKVEALKLFNLILLKSSKLPSPDLRKVPAWVRVFFHPKTLKETINFIETCKTTKNYFLLACTLGILHHQRPGFLSYPSSHLVPYLRNKKFSKENYPEMYEYRGLATRLEAKINRTYKRPGSTSINFEYRKSKIENLNMSKKYDCLISSPPYMNTLDYFRDNRLRIWFLNKSELIEHEKGLNTTKSFSKSIESMAKNANENLKNGKYAILIVGEKINNSKKHPSNKVIQIFSEYAPKLKLEKIVYDDIPDVRRARRDCKKIKRENILIFKKIKK
jgi:methylase of polypeptide subunit release factors